MLLTAPAEHVLEVGVRRAAHLIHDDRYDEALRALVVAGAAAELIEAEANPLETT